MNRSEFDARNAKTIAAQVKAPYLAAAASDWYYAASCYDYAYRWSWQGVPMLQHPCDTVALQEIIFATRPDLIIETGVAWGGSLLFYASMMKLYSAPEAVPMLPRIIGIEVGLMGSARKAADVNKRPWITLIEGSSTNASIVSQVAFHAEPYRRRMIVLDSNHTHDHVLAELHAYAPLVSKGCYLVVMDTIIEHMPESFSADRPWGPGNNPATAVEAFMQTTDRFEVDEAMDAKLLVSAAPGGWLRCLK